MDDDRLIKKYVAVLKQRPDVVMVSQNDMLRLIELANRSVDRDLVSAYINSLNSRFNKIIAKITKELRAGNIHASFEPSWKDDVLAKINKLHEANK